MEAHLLRVIKQTPGIFQALMLRQSPNCHCKAICIEVADRQLRFRGQCCEEFLVQLVQCRECFLPNSFSSNGMRCWRSAAHSSPSGLNQPQAFPKLAVLSLFHYLS
eukprot:gnl/TRDRNA2_/TRDRNA2_175520_c0_seq7.p2 gnl/TRDRNA2_/TRDRNA2_175520_c0~~gnl/TRDRNA2_/TRDRNA2_175520_c0_seq7.p2  ORF type:complete len:106 (-),score=8.04 gnl/TRDRNA2_/TRDRNA2_175520_c0_seq7:85-402(-)